MTPFGFHSLGSLSFHYWVGCALFSQHLLKIGSESTKVKPFEGDSFPLSILCRQSQGLEEGQLNESVGNLKKFSNLTPVRRAKHICAKSLWLKEMSVVKRMEEPGRITWKRW